MNKYVLEEYFIKYLRDVREVKESTINHYLDALRYISRYLVKHNKIKESIYELEDVIELEAVVSFLKTELEFIELNRRGHQMYSSGLNNYLRFITGESFEKSENIIEKMDIPIAPIEQDRRTLNYWKRSSVIKVQAIVGANYQCEIDGNHKTFISKSTNKQYMEAHHAIPMEKQSIFPNNSLDIYANIVCLCPICHRLVHYGIESEKKIVVDKIYFKRADRLRKSGIRLSKSEFEAMIY